MKKYKLTFCLIIIFISSCISPKIHNALIEEKDGLLKASLDDKMRISNMEEEIQVLKQKIKRLNKTIKSLKSDSVQNGINLYNLRKKYDDLSITYDLLSSKNTRFIQQKAKETKKLLEELENSQNNLLLKENELNAISDSLRNQKMELEIRSERVRELEEIINFKDSIVTSIRSSISKALVGLEGEGLTIEQRNSKVYLLLDEDLLFASGKYDVNENGKLALNKLSEAIKNNSNLNILVEGHTDSISFTGTGLIKSNWDLSVMRATSVVKVLIQNSEINPEQLTAAGKGEHVPIATNKTKEGRSKNLYSRQTV